jgi:AcrR family transcriptional regulator
MTDASPQEPGKLSPTERRRRNREEMESAILATAQEIMREQGVAALSLHEVARRLGMQAPALYYYFTNKAAIYDALFQMGISLSREQISRVRREYGPTWERFQAVLESYMAFAHEHPELFHLIFERPVPGFTPSEESMRASRLMVAEAQEVIAEAVRAGTIRPDMPLDQAFDVVVAVMHGLTAYHMANEPELPPGSGRFGSLIPAIVRLFRTSWGSDSQETPPQAGGTSQDAHP